MPFIKNLNKVKRKLKGSNSQLHPKGRKYKQLTRATLRDIKMNERKHARHTQREHDLLRVKFFQTIVKDMNPDIVSYNLEEMKELITAFISKDDDELKKLRDQRRPGRPASSRLSILEEKIKHDKSEFETGFLLPDLSNVKTVQSLREWKGNSGGLNLINSLRISKSTTEIPEPIYHTKVEGKTDMDVDNEDINQMNIDN